MTFVQNRFSQTCFFSLQGWYIVTYALGIYHLNLFIAFLTPKIDPALEELGEEDLGVLIFVNCIKHSGEAFSCQNTLSPQIGGKNTSCTL